MPTTADAHIGRRLRVIRERSNLTQEELARAAGITVSALTQIERGKVKDPRLGTVVSLAQALKVGLDELVGLTGLDDPGR